MDHRQEYPERDELRAKFTRWLETVIKRAKIDYLRKNENRPETISYEDIYRRRSLLIWHNANYGRAAQECRPRMILKRNG